MIGEAPLSPASDPMEAPAPSSAWMPGQSRPMSPEDVSLWWKKIDRGETIAKLYHPQWERGLKAYVDALTPNKKDDVDALLDYRHVESKKAQLFHRTPDVTLLPIEPEDPMLPIAAAIPVRQKVLNFELGPKGANAKRALHKTLIDTLAASGFLIVEVGFEQALLPVPGAVNPDGTPVEVPIWSRRFLQAVSSKKLIIPADFHDTDYDRAPFLAVRGTCTVTQARRMKWKLPVDFTGSAQRDSAIFEHHTPMEDASDPLVEYVKVWYLAAHCDPAVFNPELYRCLVLVKGCEDAAWHVDSPFQTLTPEGALTDDSMIGNPIHVGTLRDLVDSAYVPSDLVVGEQLSLELNKFRTDMVKNRTAHRAITLVSDAIGKDKAAEIFANRGGVVPQEHIGEGGSQRLIAVVTAGTEPRENYENQHIIENDQQQALGVGENQGGQFSKTKRTATEVRTVQGNSSARAESEKDRIREYFIALVRKFDTVVQRTMTPQELQKILGAGAAAVWEQWRALPGRYGYDILPDSGRYVDAQQHLTHVLDTYNLLRKDERVNTEELLTIVARALNRDPAKFIAPSQDKPTEPPSASIAFKGEDTTNAAMGNLLLDFCANANIKLRPETIAAFATQHALMAATGGVGVVGPDNPDGGHAGAADRTEEVNKHAGEKTGGMPGVGVM